MTTFAPGKTVGFWRRLHCWLAYTLGAVFVIQGLSGSMMVLGEPIDAWINPELTPGKHSVPLVEMADALDRQYPNAVGLGVKRQDKTGQLVLGFWPEPDPLIPSERNYRLARMNISTGKVVSVNTYGSFPHSRYDVLAYLYAIHTNLTLGAVGRFLLIFTTLGLLLLLVAGIINWRNRRKWLKYKKQADIVDTPWAKWHRKLGLSSVAVLIVLLSSGLALQYETLLDPSFSYQSKDRVGQEHRLPLRKAWQAATRKYPDAKAMLIMSPFWEGGTFRIDLIPKSGKEAGKTVELFLDAYSARILHERTSDDRKGLAYWVGLLEPLHGGSILGVPGEILAFLAGLVPLMMLLLGRAGARKLRHKL
ncbi:PepSY domain-containing protein [Hydrogenovibrio sp. JE_KL2]|uniref:PepSY-associated TM helix domain-containing protein n=1 Tax=Hydrogenovibrio sp. JE_KL2 TaxID=2651188 RepID=UPI001562E558|nr:PepSY-associated TM helix domain-containing protein [Hydrogenovibrio sp. JE_KL2]